MPLSNDKTGNRYGRWTVVRKVPRPVGQTRTGAWYEIRCDCGALSVKPGTALSDGPSCSKSCGCLKRERLRARHRDTAGNWRGGRIIDPINGYALIYQPGHPNAKGNGYVPEHRYVMSEALGRPLLREENVHHKNGVRDDNRLENLELWIKPPTRGIRAKDAAKWARMVLELYGDLFPEGEDDDD